MAQLFNVGDRVKVKCGQPLTWRDGEVTFVCPSGCWYKVQTDIDPDISGLSGLAAGRSPTVSRIIKVGRASIQPNNTETDASSMEAI